MTFTGPIPFQEAIETMSRKGLLPTTLSSAELRLLEAQIRRRAVFSARMTRVQVLARLKRLITSIVSGLRDPQEGVFLSIPEAKAQLREELEAEGWETDPEDRDTIKDFYSDRRRQLIIETNVLDTLGAGRHKAETSAVSLDVNPAWELVRVSPRSAPRNWNLRWQAAGDAVDWVGAAKAGSAGRMFALKTSPIWQALGDGAGGFTDTLGNPWEPFAFQSGMGRVQIPRRQAEELGLILPGQVQQPDQAGTDLNGKVSASLKDFDSELKALFANDPLFLAERERVRMRAVNTVRRLNTMALLGELQEAA